MRLVVAAAVLLGLMAPGPAFAQGGSQATPDPAAAPPHGIDVSRLPLDLDRIQRELQRSTIREERDGLNISYVIGVFAPAPQLRLFTAEDNLTTGPVPYGGPTHKEVLEQLTPQEFRAPAADFSALLRWLSERSKE